MSSVALNNAIKFAGEITRDVVRQALPNLAPCMGINRAPVMPQYRA